MPHWLQRSHLLKQLRLTRLRRKLQLVPQLVRHQPDAKPEFAPANDSAKTATTSAAMAAAGPLSELPSIFILLPHYIGKRDHVTATPHFPANWARRMKRCAPPLVLRLPA